MSEFRRAYSVSTNSETRTWVERSRREGYPQMKGIKKIKWKRGGNEKLEVVGKRGRGTEVTERGRDKYGVHLVREGRRYRGRGRKHKDRVAAT